MPINDQILFIGPYRQNDGWGLAAKDYILSLLTQCNTLTCRPIYLSNNITNTIPQSIINKENDILNDYSMVIQNTLPFSMTKIGGIKNIGLLFIENQNFNSDSIFNLNTMDEIWVSSDLEKNNLQSVGITTPIKKIGHAIDTNNMIVSNKTFRFNDHIKDNYKFYVIGEYIQRKNIKDVITAFHLEFDITEPVSLVIKTSLSGINAKDLANQIKHQCAEIKKSLRTHKQFHQEIIITDRLTNDQLNELHQNCDCFVMTSYAEAFCRPIAEALCHGKYCILSSNMGINEDIDETDRSVVDCIPQPVILNNPEYVGNMDIYNGNEIWYQPSIVDLRYHMRQAFDNRPKVDAKKYLSKFSYATIGQKICQAI